MAWSPSPSPIPKGWKTARPAAPIPKVSSDPWEEAAADYLWRNASEAFSSALNKLRGHEDIDIIMKVTCGIVTMPQELDHLVNATAKIWYDCLLDQVQADCTGDKKFTDPYRLKLKPWQQQIKHVFIEHQKLLGDQAVKDKTLMMEPIYEIAVLLGDRRLPDHTPRQVSSSASKESLHIAGDVQNRQDKLSQAIMKIFPDYPRGLEAFTPVNPNISTGAATPGSATTVRTPATPAISTPPTALTTTASLSIPRPKQDSLNMHSLQHSLPQTVGQTGVASSQQTGPSISQASPSTSADPSQTRSAGLEDKVEHEFNADGMTLNELRAITVAPPEDERKQDVAGLEELSNVFLNARSRRTSQLRRLSIQARTTHMREAIIKFMQDAQETGCEDED